MSIIDHEMQTLVNGRRDPAKEFAATMQEIDMLFDRLRNLSLTAERPLWMDEPGRCTVCGGDDTVRELDYATRWNELRIDREPNYLLVHQHDDEFDGVAFFCYECKTPYRLPDNVTVDWT